MCSRTVLSIPATTGNIIPALTTFTYVSGTTSVSCYLFLLSVFGLLAPYLERACFLLATPAVSRVPLMMWYLVPGRSLMHDHHELILRCAPVSCVLARDVAGYLDTVRKTYSGNFTKCRVRLLRGCSLNCGADTSLLRRRSVGCTFL